MIEDFKTLFVKDLDRLKSETELFHNDSDLWLEMPGISNSAGNLTLHLCGNLRHFLGHAIGKSGYQRKRDDEFSTTGLSRAELTDLISVTKDEVEQSFQHVADEDLNLEFPVTPFKEPVSTLFMLTYLSGHLNYHLGQINYLRRIIQG